MEATYMLNCDNCGDWFESTEAFPKPHLCPKCLIVYKAGERQGRESMLKEVAEFLSQPYRRAWQEDCYFPEDLLELPETELQAFLKERGYENES